MFAAPVKASTQLRKVTADIDHAPSDVENRLDEE